jgi:hypothetical protein
MIVAAGMLLASVAPAYYHFVHFSSPAGPYSPVPEKFDLTALPNKTLNFYVAEQGPAHVSASDSFPAVISQLKLAAKAWSDVATSDLRLNFGGLITFGTPQVAPGIDVTFDDDIPPGLRAQTFITSWDYSAVTSLPFIPILRTRISLRNDLTQYPYDATTVIKTYTFDESFFLTLVHEFGHSVGLQHSLASGAMATEVTRGTTKSRPITPDDVAGISVLYPAAAFAGSTGTLRGRVTATTGAQGVNMASVVVISPSGPAISNLSNPDGTYEVRGIPPGVYYVYVHPLPPADTTTPYPDSIFPPFGSLTSRAAVIATRDVFKTQFQPSTYVINAGAIVDNVNFSVTRQSTVPMYAVTTYAQVASNWLKATPIASSQRASLIATGAGIVSSDGTPVPGLSVSVMGGQLAGTSKYGSQYMSVSFNPPYGSGPRHLIFSANGDQYVLPYAFNLYDLNPPNVTTVSATTDSSGNPAALVKGSNLTADSKILFDGVVARTLAANPDGSLLVSLPSASGSYQSRVVALNTDGQSSLFLQGPNATQFSYDAGDFGAFATNTSALNAGVEAVIQIEAMGTNFVDGQVTVGFGSSDISVRRVMVVNPRRLYVNVGIQDQAPTIATTVTVNSGLQLLSLPVGLQILPRVAGTLYLSPNVINAITGQPGISAGSTVFVDAVNIGSSMLSATVVLNDQAVPTQPVLTKDGRLSFNVPQGFTPGPALLRVRLSNGILSLPIAINIDPPPPVIENALAGTSGQLDSFHFVRPGDLISLIVDGIPAGTNLPIVVNVGGLDHIPVSIQPTSSGPVIVQLVLAAGVSTGPQVPVTLALDTRISAPFPIPIGTN